MTCGCGRPHDRRGRAASITIEDLEQAADAAGQTLDETVDHIVRTLAIHEREPRGTAGNRRAGAEQGLAHPAGEAPVAPAPRGTPASES